MRERERRGKSDLVSHDGFVDYALLAILRKSKKHTLFKAKAKKKKKKAKNIVTYPVGNVPTIGANLLSIPTL